MAPTAKLVSEIETTYKLVFFPLTLTNNKKIKIYADAPHRPVQEVATALRSPST
jgi:hypothetical protein